MVCVYSRHLFKGGGIPPAKKLTIFPQTAAKLCALSFFRPDSKLQIHHGNFLLMDNKHTKLFVIKQSERCTLMPKLH